MPKEYLDEPIELLNRSRESYSHNHMDTFDAGQCVPIWMQPVIAGETWQISASALIRTLPLVSCPMDNAKFSMWFFWVPSRILYDKYKNFRGELEDYWTGTETSYTLPGVSFPSGGFSEGSVADHLGIPTKVAPSNIKFSALPFRAVAQVWNEWFRDQNLMPKILFNTNGSDVTGSQTGGDYINTCALGGDLPPLSRPHDLFGSCLPFAQRGAPETIPIASEGGRLPVYSGSSHDDVISPVPLVFGTVGGQNIAAQTAIPAYVQNISTSGSNKNLRLSGDNDNPDSTFGREFYPQNLWADTTGNVTATINDLRVSLAVQHLKERMAISGSRYREILRSMYGVEYPDPVMDIPTYLGGFSQPVEFQPVVQTGSTDSTSPQGNVAGYSSTGVIDNGFVHSALEDGYLCAFCGVRAVPSYQQGLDRMWMIMDELDIWNPLFNGLGQMAVNNYEIYLDDSSGNKNNDVFGYQDAWYFYHNRPNVVAGQFRSNATNSLARWHFADNYGNLPVLGRYWMADNSASKINRVLAAQAPTYPQFMMDVTFEGTVTSAMPVHAAPGLNRI